jgi:ribonucleoside-diphosphate reductase alpha chain
MVKATPMELTIKDSPVVRVATKEGYSHKITPDHPLWVVDRGWVEAKDLKPGDRVETQQRFDLWGDVNEPEAAFLCGLVAGDGTFGKDGVCVDLWDPKTCHLQHEVEQYARHVIARLAPDAAGDPIPTFNDYADQNKARLSSVPLAKSLATFGFCRETKMVVPEFVWRGNKETVGAYLRGLFVTDGTIQAIPGQMTVVSLASTDRQLLESVQILLMNAGVKSRICALNKAGVRMMPDGNGGLKGYECKESYRLLVTSTWSCRRLNNLARIGQERGNVAFLENLKRQGYREKFWVTVESIEPLPNEDVYCPQVNAEDRAWTCQGLLTKNTEILRHTKPSKWEDGERVEVGETAVCSPRLPQPRLVRLGPGRGD